MQIGAKSMNNAKKVVFLGSKDIGLECLKILNKNKELLNYEIVGVLTNNRGNKIREYSVENNLKILKSLDEFLFLERVDIAFSVQYHEILKKIHIEKAKELIVNLHMAPLPEYRGCNQFSFAIIEKKKVFGTTIHLLDEGIDSGDILFESRFEIPEDCWVEELYELTVKKSIELFQNSLEKIIKLKIKPIPQSSLINERGCSIHFRNEINDLKKIDLSWDKDKIERYIRATYMPGFEPPYFIINNKKFYISEWKSR
jgi:methionyl-tRNA formyltransferase